MKFMTSFFLIGATALVFSNPGMSAICAGEDACTGYLEGCKAKCAHLMGGTRKKCEKKKQCAKKDNYDYKNCLANVGCAPEEIPGYSPPDQPEKPPIVCAEEWRCARKIDACKLKCDGFLGSARKRCIKKKQCNKTSYEYKQCLEDLGCLEKDSDSDSFGGGY